MCANAELEFRRQLSCLQSLVERIPQCTTRRLLQTALADSRAEILRLHAEFLRFHSEYIIQKVSQIYRYTVFLSKMIREFVYVQYMNFSQIFVKVGYRTTYVHR